MKCLRQVIGIVCDVLKNVWMKYSSLKIVWISPKKVDSTQMAIVNFLGLV